MADRYNSKLSVSSLDFDNIKTNLKQYLSTQEEFKDINFEGAGINILMDLLAYNTHYQSFYTNMVANEMFLDSAIKRDSIVSLAKHLGYTPTSVTSPKAVVDIYTPTASLTDNIPKGTIVKGTQGGKSYEFSVMETVGYTLDSEGLTVAPNITIKEGKIVTLSYIYDGRTDLKLVIPNNADTSTLSVRVQTSTEDNSGYTDTWTLSTDLNTIAKTDKAYHVQEIENGEYEIYFGDNIVGKKPDNGNVIHLQYLVTKGTEANNLGSSDKEGARVFTYAGSTVKVVSKATGGAVAETNKSIKFYAPKTYQAQDRAVTAKDYEATLLTEYSDIESVFVWGGQDNDPPEYGKVFISLKPKSGLTVDETTKESIRTDILKKKNIVSITPEIVDPDYLYLLISSDIVFEKARTVLDKESVAGLVRDTIVDYVDNDLEKFDKDLYFSKLTKLMDESSDSIVGNDTIIKLQRRFQPSLNITANYKIDFGNPILHPHDGHKPVLESSPFKYKTDIGDEITAYLQDDGYGGISLYRFDSEGRKVLVYYGSTAVGTIDYASGIINLQDFRPLSFIDNTHIKINVPLEKKNIFASKSRILTIDKFDSEAIRLSIKDIAE
tara:strand:+ start:11303 stop:13123 length:1821 start_codon:yes stop_codon:yes gene_type:complete